MSVNHIRPSAALENSMSDNARAYLLQAPCDDPRPDTFSSEVILSVIRPNLKDLQGWLQYRVPGLEDDIVRECAYHAIDTGRGDAFSAALVLREELNWPADAHLVFILHNMCAAIPVAIRYAEREWQMRTGVRFPGEKGDTIEWYDESNRRYTGVVQTIDKVNAVAFVQPMVGKINQGAPRRVKAERVTENRTRAVGERPIGFRVEPEEEAEAS